MRPGTVADDLLFPQHVEVTVDHLLVAQLYFGGAPGRVGALRTLERFQSVGVESGSPQPLRG